MKKFDKIAPSNLGENRYLKLMAGRLGNLDVPPKYYVDTVDKKLMAGRLGNLNVPPKYHLDTVDNAILMAS